MNCTGDPNLIKIHGECYAQRLFKCPPKTRNAHTGLAGDVGESYGQTVIRVNVLNSLVDAIHRLIEVPSSRSVEGSFYTMLQLIYIERLLQIIARTVFEYGNREFLRTVSGHDDDKY